MRLLYRLCRDFGTPYIHPDYLLTALTEEQMQGWELQWEIEPWGTPADDQRAATGAWASVFPHATKTKVDRDAFLLQWGEREQPTPEEYRKKHREVMRRASGRGKLFDV